MSRFRVSNIPWGLYYELRLHYRSYVTVAHVIITHTHTIQQWRRWILTLCLSRPLYSVIVWKFAVIVHFYDVFVAAWQQCQILGNSEPPPRQLIPQDSYRWLCRAILFPLQNLWIRIVIWICNEIEWFTASETSRPSKLRWIRGQFRQLSAIIVVALSGNSKDSL